MLKFGVLDLERSLKRIVDSCCPVLTGLGVERLALEIIIKISPNAEARLGLAGNLNLISKSLTFKDCELMAHNPGPFLILDAPVE